jgi:2-polyprenyl-6-methoxyphenol hydroxylase-like FAD-dependent oxidoreductase
MKPNPEVLVVGAGPVGLLAALRLRENGVPVRLIDQRSRISGHSYACALHPHSLKLLQELGLAAEAMRCGRSLHSLAFYEGAARQAEAHFTDLPVEFPFVLVLSQSALEDLLERELAERWGLHVSWNHRLSDLRCGPEGAVAVIENLMEAAEGSTLPDGARAVQDRREEHFAFVIGADGRNSFVRDRLKIDYESFGEGEEFVLYEFETDADLPHEVRVVMEENRVNVMWPLSDKRCRWSFQLSPAEVLGKAKGWQPLATRPSEVEKGLAEHARRLLEERAPWFQGNIDEIDWQSGIYFERFLAARLGQDRCWLAGDAAHLTSPVGVQSLNIGLKEAAHLADAMSAILQGGGAPKLLEVYEARQRQEWLKLLKPGALQEVFPVNSWAAAHRERILSCLPASGCQLESLLNQLGLHMASNERFPTPG